MLKKLALWLFKLSQEKDLFAQRDPLHILIVRVDRLGDVILSTPVFEAIKRHYPRAQVSVMAQQTVKPLLEHLSCVDSLMPYDPQGVHHGLKGFIHLYQQIRAHRFSIAIVLQSNWRIALALFLARVPYRIGPLSKLYSYLLYNRGVRQRRSHVEMHEADYNLQLLKRLRIRVGARNVPTRVALSDEVLKLSKQWLMSQGWDPSHPFIVIHPGMGGSALNWPESHYIELARALVLEERLVLISGGPLEINLLDRIEKELGEFSSKIIFFRNRGEYSVDFFGGILSFAQLIIAPSTGPLHLAVALGKSVLTFYPPIRVQSALRWGPYVSDEELATVLVPEVYCGQDFKCAGSLCHYYPCMKGITVKQAVHHALKQSSQPQLKPGVPPLASASDALEALLDKEILDHEKN